MEYTRLKVINEYISKNIAPAKTPGALFEMYSVPSFETGYPEYLLGSQIASNKAVVQKMIFFFVKSIRESIVYGLWQTSQNTPILHHQSGLLSEVPNTIRFFWHGISDLPGSSI